MVTGQAASFTAGTPAGDENNPTFMTATHMQEQEREEAGALVLDMKPKRIYDNPGVEALEELEQHERDMNEMMKYLCEVEEMFRKGEDLKEIRSMMDVTRENLD